MIVIKSPIEGMLIHDMDYGTIKLERKGGGE